MAGFGFGEAVLDEWPMQSARAHRDGLLVRSLSLRLEGCLVGKLNNKGGLDCGPTNQAPVGVEALKEIRQRVCH